MKDKVALVTGAGRGLGQQIAIALANLGLSVVVNAAHEETARDTAHQIHSANKQALPIVADVSNREEVISMVGQALTEFGRIDILVNNAGVFINKPSLDLTDSDWQHTLDVNITGSFLCCQIIAPHMIDIGGGKIINISSTSGLVGFPERLPYSVSKAGLIMLTKVLAIELAQFGIRVNAVAPGPMKTDMVRQQIERGAYTEADYSKRIPLGRMAEVIEVVQVVTFLCSDASSYITGETIVVDGGWTAYGYL